MTKFILLSFVLLGLAFYAMSGGTSFDPVTARNEIVAARTENAEKTSGKQNMPADQPAQAEEPAEAVTRVSLSLASLDDILAQQKTAAESLTTESDAATEPDIEQTTARVLPSIIFAGSTTAVGSASTFGSTDIRAVNRDNVNVRGGPSTNFAVVNQMNAGDRVEVLDNPGNGWVQLRPLEGGPIGWMADFLLSGG